MTKPGLGLLLGSLLLACASGSASTAPGSPGGGDGCAGVVERARARVAPVVASASRACTRDSDCLYAVDQADCFGGGCPGPLLGSVGQRAVKDVLADVATHECQEFAALRCEKQPVPPCAPPAPVACRAGVCAYGGPPG